MKIGIIGAGTVARTLGAAWAAKGHAVHLGVRNSGSPTLTAWLQTNAAVTLATPKEAAAFGEVVLVAINPWTEIEGVVTSLVEDLAEKIVIDVSNDIMFDGQPRLANTALSMGERMQQWLPNAHVVKALNITPAAMMVEPQKSGIIPAITWTAGNDTGAKQTVSSLLQDLGWQSVVDLGAIENSKLQEGVGLMLSIIVSGAMKTQQV